MKWWMAGVLCALALAGCASKQTLVPQVHTSEAHGVKTISVASESVQCERPQCPTLAAQWLSSKPGQAVLTVGVPYQNEEIVSADFFVGTEQLRVRSRSQRVPAAHGYPVTAFDVPLRTVERLAYAPRIWVRVITAQGAQFDAMVHTGEESSRAYSGLHYFMGAVQAVNGEGARSEENKGGLIDRLGVGGHTFK